VEVKLSKNVMKIISQKQFILLAFLFIIVVTLLYSIFYSQETNTIKLVRFIALVIYSLLALLTHKNNKVATFVLAIFILLSGLGTLIVAFLIGLDQLVSKLFFFLIGGYFSYGGVRLIKIGRETGRL